MKKRDPKKLELLFLDHCRKKKFFSKSDRVLLALSGGMDSMVMAHFLGILSCEFGLKIGVAHLNHSLRKSASDLDEMFVKNFALSNQYPFHHKKVNVRKEARSTKTSLEEAARNMRYVFLEDIARRQDYTKICTAHHFGDQAETVLMRIIKGSGLSGLSGIRETRGSFVRPLLIFTKDDIKLYAKARKINYVEDLSNLDTMFLRNRIRHDLMPLLKNKFDPQIEKHLNQLSLIADEAHTFFKHHAKAQFSRVCKEIDGKIFLEIKAFNRYLRAQRQAVIGFIFEKYFRLTLQFADYERLYDLIEKMQSGKRIVFGKVVCTRTSEQVVFKIQNKTNISEFCFHIDIGRSYKWDYPELSFKASAMPRSPKLRNEFGLSPDVEFIDYEKIAGHLNLRNWRFGDRFMPLGMPHLKRLSDFFIDNKISLADKKRIPVLCERIGEKENIIWVCGMRIDQRYKVDNTTHHIIKLECKRHEKDHQDGKSSISNHDIKRKYQPGRTPSRKKNH